MTLIFLDIDGVLIPNYLQGAKLNIPRKHKFDAPLNPKSVELVNKLAKENNAKIVVSSTWRLHDKDLHVKINDPNYQPFDLRDFLKRSGLTADFAEDWHTPKPTRFGDLVNGRPRGFEINDYLEEHKEVTNWVALDDDISGFETKGILDHLARINPRMGFLEEDFEIANKILKNTLF